MVHGRPSIVWRYRYTQPFSSHFQMGRCGFKGIDGHCYPMAAIGSYDPRRFPGELVLFKIVLISKG